jgi:polyphosphate kinase 2
MSKSADKRRLHELWIELVKLQRAIISRELQVLVILEGRDAAGKDGMIRTITRHLSPRETRVFAIGKPSDRDERAWYFQRFVPHLPVAGELVLFNRSWYNRAGVEVVMGFCTRTQTKEFLAAVVPFERLLVQSGVQLFKYYLDVSKAEQRRRLAERKTDPLTQWKVSPIDAQAQRKWRDYSRARDAMLAASDHPDAPWTIVRADEKPKARLALIGDLLGRMEYAGRRTRLARGDERVIARYAEIAGDADWLAR